MTAADGPDGMSADGQDRQTESGPVIILPDPASREALLERLSRHADYAAAQLTTPFLRHPGRSVGFVDAIASDSSGITWIVGWIMDDGVLDRSIVIVDKAAHAAGFACTLIDRADLPPGGRGFVGVVQSDWRAMADLPPYFFLTDGSGRFLETLDPPPIRTKRAITPAVRDLLLRASGRYGDLMREVFFAVDDWNVTGTPDVIDRLHIDRAAVLPGFGAMITGWAISPNKSSDRFALKARGRVAATDDRSIVRFARRDLSRVYDKAGLALDRAGFTALFRADLTGGRVDDMALRCTWSDGTATVVAIPPDRIRLLGVTTPIEQVLDYYPAIEAESFFADFARDVIAAAQARSRALTIYEAQPMPAALILALPATTSDLFLVVEEVLRHAAMLPPDWGVVLAGCPDNIRPLLVSLFADLKRVTGRRCSLFFTAPGETNNEIVTGVIDALGLTRFAFVSGNTLLTKAGWTAMRDHADGLVLLEIGDPANAYSRTAGLDAFVCDATIWQDITAAARPRIGGVTFDATASDAPPTRIVPAAALALSSRRPSALIAKINEIGAAARG